MEIVHLMRGGAPDKAMFPFNSNNIQVIKHDFTNLVDYPFDKIVDICEKGEYILPADEGDIDYANQLFEVYPDLCQEYILLPQVKLPNGNFKVIDYKEFVPKDSKVYQFLDLIGIKYAGYSIHQTDETSVEMLWSMVKDINQYALKTTSGSGSRGVILVDNRSRALSLGGKYIPSLDRSSFDKLVEFAKTENCNIMLQGLIPFIDNPKLKKVNVDFVIRDGALLSYKWDIVNQSQVFTNWDNLHIIRNYYTDVLMEKLTRYLSSMGIHNAIMNFEAFSDMESETWMVEFNWRLSNSMFEYQALNINPIESYLFNETNYVELGQHKAVRYWQCKLYSDLPDYVDGI